MFKEVVGARLVDYLGRDAARLTKDLLKVGKNLDLETCW